MFRIVAGLVGLGHIAAGLFNMVVFEGLWNKFCSSAIILAGLLYTLYAVRGPTITIKSEKPDRR
jgi:hypothetical protein